MSRSSITFTESAFADVAKELDRAQLPGPGRGCSRPRRRWASRRSRRTVRAADPRIRSDHCATVSAVFSVRSPASADRRSGPRPPASTIGRWPAKLAFQRQQWRRFPGVQAGRGQVEPGRPVIGGAAAAAECVDIGGLRDELAIPARRESSAHGRSSRMVRTQSSAPGRGARGLRRLRHLGRPGIHNRQARSAARLTPTRGPAVPTHRSASCRLTAAPGRNTSAPLSCMVIPSAAQRLPGPRASASTRRRPAPAPAPRVAPDRMDAARSNTAAAAPEGP